MNRSLILGVAVLLGVSFVSVQAANPQRISSQVIRSPVPPPSPPPNQTPTPQPQPQPPTVKCPPAKTNPPNCKTPCPSPTVVIYPAYSYPAYSYPVYYSGPSYSSSRSTYERTTTSERDQGYAISYEDD